MNRSEILPAALFVALLSIFLPFSAASLSVESASPPASRPTPTPPGDPNPLRDGLRPPPRFWDTAPHSAANVFLNDQSVVIPGPDDQVRVIVQLRDDPLSVRIKRTLGTRLRPTPAEGAALRQYANTLTAQRRQFLTQVQQQRVAASVRQEFGYLVNGAALSIKMQDWKRLEQMPQVKAVYPDYEMRVTLSDSVPLIGAPAVWAMSDSNGSAVTGQGVRVAVIDSGVDYTHPDLGGCLGALCRVIGGYDFVDKDSDPMDDFGHGTHVAGIIAAKGALTGVAPGAKLLAYRVLDSTGVGIESDIIAALERAADPDSDPLTDDGAQVINLSLGGDGNPDDPVSQAVDQAVDLGLVVVAAAGNYGGYGFETLTSPGVARKAITVAASDKSDQYMIFSSRGPVLGYEGVLKPDITAPGADIRSTVPISGALGSPDRYRVLSGTSMATPHVSGAIALLKQLHPDWTPDLLKADLMNSAKDLGKSVYQQGAGRVQVAEAATAPLVSTPGSWSFGIPSLTGASFRLSLVNVSSAPISVTGLVSTALWANDALIPFSTPTPVTYTELSSTNFTIAPNATFAVTATLNLPSDVAEGYYTGRVLFQSANYTLSVPFVFTMLSKVTVHILDENGVEVSLPQEFFRQQGVVYMLRTPSLDVRRTSGLVNQPPSIFYVPAGTYNVHGYARFWIYDALLGTATTTPKPLILSKTISVQRNETQDVYLSGASAHLFNLDASSFDGAPLYIGRWRAVSRYHNGANEYLTGLDIGYQGYKDSYLRGPLPSRFDFYIADTLPSMDFAFASDGYGYSARQSRFQQLNSAQWYEDRRNPAGFDLIENADQAYWFAWQYPSIDASTPRTLTYARNQTSHYRTRYDIYGILNRTWTPLDTNFAAGGDALFYMPSDNFSFLTPLSAGLARDIYVKGVYAYRYWNYHAFNDLFFERELYQRDWTRSYTTTQASDVWLIKGSDLLPLPTQQDETSTSGAGPLYPAVTFNNDATAVRLIHPILGSSLAYKSIWGDSPSLTAYRNGAAFYTGTLNEWWWSPSPMRQIPTQGSGAYRVVITTTASASIAYENTIQAGFTLPSTDANPPHVAALEMPQRFSLGESIPVTITVTDAESGVNRVEMRSSLDEGATWVPLSVTQSGTRYAATINPAQAMSVTLGLTAWDNAGNYLTFTSKSAAIRQFPVAFALDITPKVIYLSPNPFTTRITGSLKKSDGQPLSQAALPVMIYLNDQLAGYVRNVARLPDGTFHDGDILFDWRFIPTDFLTSPVTAQLKFVFDIGAYARQEKVFAVPVIVPVYQKYFPFIPHLYPPAPH